MLAAIKDFFLRERHLGKTPPSAKRRRRNRQRGVALVAVMIAISLTLVITDQFGTSTTVDLQAAANYRDQMRAHFLAHSATNLAELLIRVQQRVDNLYANSGIRITDFANQALLAFCGNPDEVKDAIGLSASDTKGLGADIGTCGINGPIGTDDDKLNLNCANSTSASPGLIATLTAMFSFTAYDPVFSDADADNWRRDRATQVSAIIDYIDTDLVHLHDRGGASEDYGYESLKDFYKAKNTYIDTLGEAKLIRGIDDRFWTLFGSSFTVYGSCKVNITALDNAQLIAGLLVYAAKNPNDPVIQDPQQLFKLASFVAKAKEFGMTFSGKSGINDFITFVKDPMAQLGVVAGQAGSLAGSAAGSALANGTAAAITNGAKIGLELDATKLGKIAGTGARRTYRVEAYGEIDRKQKMADGSPVFPPITSTVTGVWDTKVVPQNARKNPAPKGAWVFLKEE